MTSDDSSPYDPPSEPVRPRKGPAPGSRPTSVTVMAILGIVFGGLALLCGPFAILPYVIEMPGQPENPVVALTKENTLLLTWTIGSTVFGVVLAAVLLVGSIGALSLRRWARQTLVVYGVAGIVSVLLNFVVTVTVLLPSLRRDLAGGPGGEAAFIGGVIGGLIGTFAGLPLPALMLFFMTRPNVKAAFGEVPDEWDTF